MRRWHRLAIGCWWMVALATLCPGAEPAVALDGATSFELMFSADVLLIRKGEPVRTFSAASDTAAARGDVLRQAVAACRAHDLLLCGFGHFDLGGRPLYFPADFVTLRGMGMLHTRLTSEFTLTNDEKCIFAVRHGLHYSDVRLESTCANNVESTVTGWAKPSVDQHKACFFTRCALVGKSWTIYLWGPPTNYMRFVDCEIYGRRNLVLAAASTRSDGQYLDFYHCKFFGDSSQRSAGGGFGRGLFGVVCRGGRVRLYECSMKLKGDAKKEFIYALWTGYKRNELRPTRGVIECYNLTVEMEPNGTPTGMVKDARRDSGAIRLFGGHGSGPDGVWITEGNVEVIALPDEP